MLGCLTLTPAMDIAIETDASAAFDGNLNPLGIDFGIALQRSFDLVLYISRLDAGLNGDAIDHPHDARQTANFNLRRRALILPGDLSAEVHAAVLHLHHHAV